MGLMTRKKPAAVLEPAAPDEFEQSVDVEIVPILEGAARFDDAPALAGDDLAGDDLADDLTSVIVDAVVGGFTDAGMEAALDAGAGAGDVAARTAAACPEGAFAVVVDVPAVADEVSAAFTESASAPEIGQVAAIGAATRAAAARAALSAREAASRQAAAQRHVAAELTRRTGRRAAAAAQAGGQQALNAAQVQAAQAARAARSSGEQLLSSAASAPVVQKLSPRARRAAQLKQAQALALRARRRRLSLLIVLGAAIGLAGGVYLKRRSAGAAGADSILDAPDGTITARIEDPNLIIPAEGEAPGATDARSAGGTDGSHGQDKPR